MTGRQKGKRVKWDMANDNTTWIHPGTKDNMDKIYLFLQTKNADARKAKKKIPRFSYNQLSVLLGIRPQSVSFACLKLAFKKVPFLKIHAISYPTKQKSVKLTEKVELIREVEIKSEG